MTKLAWVTRSRGLLAGFLSLMVTSCQERVPIEIGAQAPEFRLQTLQGAWVESSAYDGQVVVVNFWQTYCGPCLHEISLLNRLQNERSEIAVIGINLDAKGARTLQPFVDRNRIDYAVLLGNEDVFKRFDGFGIPYTLVLDRANRIAQIYRGPISEDRVRADLGRLLQG